MSESVLIPGIRDQLTIKQIHTCINRCDVVKDGNEEPAISTTLLFVEAANTLFPIQINGQTFKGEKSKLDAIKYTVLDGNFLGGTYGSNPASIETLKMSAALKNRLKRDMRNENENVDFDEKSLPEQYIYAFHDSGDTPGLIQAGIQQILTPGSYIDPAGRVKTGIRMPDAGTTELSEYGFEGLSLNWEWNQDDSCTINIEMQELSLQETRNSDHQHVGQSPDYFAGNNIKNSWFENPTRYQSDDLKTTAKKYILSKELGDTTQATFARYIFDNTDMRHDNTGENNNDTIIEVNQANSCLFTLDMVLAARAKLLKIACCAKDHKKVQSEEKFRRLLFFQPIQDENEIRKARNKLQIDECIKHNNSVKFMINLIMFEKGFFIADTEYNKNSIKIYLRYYFQCIQNSIDYVNLYLLQNRDRLIEESEEYVRRFIAYLKINNIFKLKRGRHVEKYQLINTTRNLFMRENDDEIFYSTHIKPIIDQIIIIDDNDSNRQEFITGTNETYKNFRDILFKPNLDIMETFLNKFGKKTLYEQVFYLLNTSEANINSRVLSYTITPSLETALPPPPPQSNTGGRKTKRSQRNVVSGRERPSATVALTNIRKTKRNRIRLDVVGGAATGHIVVGGNEYDRFIENYRYDDEQFIYNEDTLNLLFLLNKSGFIDNRTQSKLDEVEDFLFFLYPYFQYLGESCYDVSKLKYFYTQYKQSTYINFSSVILDYLKRIKLTSADEYKSNQDIFLNDFIAMARSPGAVFRSQIPPALPMSSSEAEQLAQAQQNIGPLIRRPTARVSNSAINTFQSLIRPPKRPMPTETDQGDTTAAEETEAESDVELQQPPAKKKKGGKTIKKNKKLSKSKTKKYILK